MCNTTGITVPTMPLQTGYYRAADYTMDIRECFNTDACVGGTGAGDAAGAEYCAEGYQGPYCAVCAESYFTASGHTCSKCASSLSTAMIVWCVFLVALFLLALVVLTAFLVIDQDAPARNSHFSKSKKWITKFGKLQWGRLRIPIVAAQIVSQGVDIMGMKLPSAYESFLAWASFASLDINMLPSLECMTSTNFYDRLIFVTVFPLCGVLYLCLTYTFVVWKSNRVTAVSSFRSTSGDLTRESRLQEAKLKHFRIFLVLTFLVYSTVSSTVFQTFAWDNVLDDPAQDDTNNYTYLRVD